MLRTNMSVPTNEDALDKTLEQPFTEVPDDDSDIPVDAVLQPIIIGDTCKGHIETDGGLRSQGKDCGSDDTMLKETSDGASEGVVKLVGREMV
jgi:hypothetical protein